MVKVFREEFDYYIAHGRSMVGREAVLA